MIPWLERLAAALLARDPEEIHRLLAEAGGRTLPSEVRREAIAIAREGAAGRRTPVRALHHLHRARQLGDGPAEPPENGRAPQREPRGAPAPGSDAVATAAQEAPRRPACQRRMPEATATLSAAIR